MNLILTNSWYKDERRAYKFLVKNKSSILTFDDVKLKLSDMSLIEEAL